MALNTLFPVQAKGGDETLTVQAIQDIYCCREKISPICVRAVQQNRGSRKLPMEADIHTIAMMELAIAIQYDVWIPRQELIS